MLKKPKELRTFSDLAYALRWAHLWLQFCGKKMRSWSLDFFLGVLLSPIWIPFALILILRKKTIFVIGLDRLPNLSLFISYLEPEIRRWRKSERSLDDLIVLDFASKRNSQVNLMYSRIVTLYGENERYRRLIFWYAARFTFRAKVLKETRLWPDVGPLVKFEDEETRSGQAVLESYGCLESGKFLCYGLRRESYHQALISAGADILLNSSRNPEEDVYVEALSTFNGGSFSVVRMGTEVMFPLDREKWHNVLDYAYDLRNDFMDCFLLANCKFLLNGSTGIFWLASVFGSRVVHADVYDVRVEALRGDLQIIQRLWIEDFGRLASLEEMFQYGYYSKDKVQKLKKFDW